MTEKTVTNEYSPGHGGYSVLMSVYHKEKAEYLRRAMESIWEQSVKTDDFVLVCDGSLNDALDEVIGQMQAAHAELRVVRLERNMGLGKALCRGMKYCRNELVCRMDSDDISLPDRCEKQLAAFQADPELKIVSGTVEEFCGDAVLGARVLPEQNEDIVRFSKKRCPFNHPAVMFSRSSVEQAGGYNEEYHLFEDYYLWTRLLMNGCKAENLPDVLVRMRVSGDAYERRGGWSYAKSMLRFHHWLRKSGWASLWDFLLGAIPHAAVCLVPNKLRGLIYKAMRQRHS